MIESKTYPPTQPEPFNTGNWFRLRWEKDVYYYEIVLHQDLWKRWVLTRSWGRRGSTKGRIINTPCASYQQGLEKLIDTIKRREESGYKAVTPVTVQTRESGSLF